jgi:hypothetical protein
MAFARPDQTILIDKIPFPEITSIQDMSSEINRSQSSRRASFIQTSSAIFGVSMRKSSTASRESNEGKCVDNVECTNFLGSRSSLGRQVSQYQSADVISAALEGRGNLNTLMIETIPNGFNSGRTYYLRAPTESRCRQIVEDLSQLSSKAKKKAEVRSRWIKYQRRLRKLYWSFPFQCSVGMLIVVVRGMAAST